MIATEDQDWIDGLAGRGASGSPTTAEARALRDRILAREVVVAPPVAEEDPAREDALVARARREGLLPQTVLRRAQPLRARTAWNGWRVTGIAAGLAAAVLVAGVLLRTPEPPETTRGTRDGIVLLQASDPAGLQEEILMELRAAGIEARGYESLGKRGIDADLPDPVPEGVRRTLERHGIPVPSTGVLQVEIGEREPR
jgi:hypothetical protein